MKVSKLKLNPSNPRIIKDDKFKKLVKSIEDFPEMMEKRPMVCVTDTDGKLYPLGGNMRLKALQELKYKEIPDTWVMLADEWSEEKRKEFAIKDNVSFGEWSWDDLANEWDVEQLEEWGLDIPNFEIDEVLEAKEDDFDVPEGGIETDIVLGDLIEIGEHRLLCGDSTDSDSVAKLMNGEISEIVFTSPPYNAGELNVKGNNTTKKKYNTYADNKTESEYYDFIVSNLDAIIPHVEEIFYNIGLVENNKRVIIDVLYHYKEQFKDIIYWKKSTCAPHIQQGVVNNLVEFILCFGDGKRKFKNATFRQGSYWNVIEGPNASGNEFAKIHKATFPLYLPENIITNFTNVNAIVMDCFCGTGTTMVAAHQLKRKCYGMELDESYCQVIVDRMRKLDPTLVIKKNGVLI